MARDGSDHDWAGALLVGRALDNMQFVQDFMEAYARAMKKSARKQRRRR